MNLSRFRLTNPRFVFSVACAPGLFGLMSWTAPPAAQAEEPAAPAAKRAAANMTTPLAVSWKYTSASSPSASGPPIISGDTLYLASAARIFAIDARTGAMKWAYPSSENLKTTITGSMALGGGAIYFSSADGLYAVDATDGKLKWPRYSVKAGVTTSPLVVGDRVYFAGGDGKIYALQTATGDPADGVWSTAKSAGISSGGDLIGDMVDFNDTVYYVTSDNVIHSVSLATGQQRWGTRLSANLTSATPVIAGEFLYIPAGDAIQAYRISNGQFRWQARLGDTASAPPAVDTDGAVYVIRDDRYILAITDNGRTYPWKKAPRIDNETDIPPVIVGDTLLVGTARGGLYAYNKADGSLKWRFVMKPSATFGAALPATANVAATPLVDGNTLYVFTDDGTLTSFRSDAPDKLPPTVVPLTPEIGDDLNGSPPFYIAALITDEGSGLDMSSMTVKVDDKAVARVPLDLVGTKPGYTFNEDNGFLQYMIDESGNGRSATFVDGPHTITISVKDYMGNLATKSWTFHVNEDSPKHSHPYTGAANAPSAAAPGGRGGRGGRGGFGGGRGGGGRGGGRGGFGGG